MIALVAFVFVLAATWATTWATVAWVWGMDTDFQNTVLAAVACLLAAISLTRVDLVRRRRMAAGRAAVWARRDREAGRS
jgi:hypothetical protein